MKKQIIIAEIGSVHDGSLGNACELVKLAASCGADVAKFQTHIAEAETLSNAPAPKYFQGESRWDYFRRTAFTADQWRRIRATCEDVGIDFLSSPFSEQAVDLLESVGVASYKIPSGEVTNLPLLEKVAGTGKPVYLSSGMSDWKELDAAVEILKGGGPLCVMQCTSAYPCPPERAGINIIPEMAKRYGVPVGFSDHVDGFAAAFAAAAMGATVIEKHLTFSRRMYGSDAPNAMEPEDFIKYCHGLRDVWRVKDSPVDKNNLGEVLDMKRIFEKSIVIARQVKAGTILSMEDLAYKKPGDGISAARFRDIVGRRTVRDLAADHKLDESDLE